MHETGGEAIVPDPTPPREDRPANSAWRTALGVAAAATVLAGLFLASRYHFLLFHTLAELFIIVVAASIFVITWNSRQLLDSNYLRFVGAACLFIAALHLLHAMAYRGMAIFSGSHAADLPTELWIAVRYLTALTFVVAPLLVGRGRVGMAPALAAYAVVTAALVASIFGQVFPDCFRMTDPVAGTGTTTAFKQVSEIVIAGLFAVGIVLLLWRRRHFHPRVLRFMVAALAMSVPAELAFYFYQDVYGLRNLLGHYLTLVSFYLIYRAIVQTGLRQPYELLFRELKQRERALGVSEQRFRTLADFTADWEYWIGPDGRFLYVSPSSRSVTGYAAETFHRDPDLLRRIVHPEDLARVLAHLDQKHEDSGLETLDFRIVTADGRVRWIGHRCQPVFGPDGRWLGTRASNRDVTERRQALEAARRAADDLERSNRDLEQFAYVASHDLQEPLRMVTGYLQLLQRRYQGRLDADADEFIGYAVDGAARMQNLIQDLLAFSRVGTRGKAFQPAPVEQALARALANLGLAIEETGATVTCGELPVLPIDAPQIAQLFQNLIGNAIKFRHPDRRPVVRVEARRDGNMWLFRVADNGIGIEPQYFERIFHIFERLHGRQEYGGTGIGLAVCKKIVERHGGSIRVESTLGAGATFSFTLPAARAGEDAADAGSEDAAEAQALP